MPMKRELYPPDWESLAHRIKADAKWDCQECGKPCRLPGESKEHFAIRIAKTPWNQELVDVVDSEEFGAIEVPMRFGRFVLTVAHLNHRPEDCRRENLRAWCSCCHARYDLAQLALKQQLNRERLGQLNLIDQINAQSRPSTSDDSERPLQRNC